MSNDTIKNSLNLPNTKFPMKGNLASKAENYIANWNEQIIHTMLNREKTFYLHDGPPYSNGDIHIGHALNKILKDFSVRFHYLQGYNAQMMPGWDCHGLPIELKVEEKTKKNKDITIREFHHECRLFAEKWMQIQQESFRKLGVMCDWQNKYTTMDNQIPILKSLYQFIDKQLLYCDKKIILWSIAEQTVLADAEVIYQDIECTTTTVLFPITDNQYILAWTTTPWTLPSNQALAYNENIEYCEFEFENKNVIASVAFAKSNNIAKYKKFDINTIKNKKYTSIFTQQKQNILHGDFVTESGTGIVHIAPAHGQDDYDLAKQYNIEIQPEKINEYGVYNKHAPEYLIGKKISQVDDMIIEKLQAQNLLYSTEKIQHSSPFSWRSKKPLIFKIMNQWFVNIQSIKKDILKKAEQIHTIPESSKTRLLNMIESRPDWCISRQRKWGVPLAIFMHRDTKEILKNKSVNEKVLKEIEQHSIAIWHEKDEKYFLESVIGEEYKQYQKVTDIIEVWFDSGASHLFKKPHTRADVYLEGSDQHRGWFQTSILHKFIIDNDIPFNTLITHGFVLDAKGYKMSKSIGNVVDPIDIINQYGADVLRVWVACTDYTKDMTIGNEILKTCSNKYRKIRNTIRYTLSVCEDEIMLQNKGELDYLDKFMLQVIKNTQESLQKYGKQHNFHKYFDVLYDLCCKEISSIYFESRKDISYCGEKTDSKRIGYLYVMSKIYVFLVQYLSVIIPFTCEEAWQYTNQTTLIQTTFEDHDQKIDYENDYMIGMAILQLKDQFNKACANQEEKILLNMHVFVHEKHANYKHEIKNTLGVSEVSLHQHDEITIKQHTGTKCARCWQKHKTINDESLCVRCEEMLKYRNA